MSIPICNHLINLSWWIPHGKEKYQSMDNTKIGIEEETLIEKNQGISRWKVQKNTQKLNWYVWTVTDVFLNQKRINVCVHTVKMASSLLCVYIHLLSSDWERHLWLSSVYMCLSSRDLLIFLVRVSSFYSYFSVS
jgi:hypothetical protein